MGWGTRILTCCAFERLLFCLLDQFADYTVSCFRVNVVDKRMIGARPWHRISEPNSYAAKISHILLQVVHLIRNMI